MSASQKEGIDVLVVGAGPAGACLAANLAPTHRIMLLDRADRSVSRPGESLVPAAQRLLSDMGLAKAFAAENHDKWHANVSRWGDERLEERSFVRDLDGHGWLVDRSRFDRWMRSVACSRGAAYLAPATLCEMKREDDGWLVTISIERRQKKLRTRLIVDATGRRGVVARRLGVARHVRGRLISRWVNLSSQQTPSAGTTFVVSTRNGWWYSAPTSDGCLVAFHTDADLPGAQETRSVRGLVDAAREVGLLSHLGLSEHCWVRSSGTRAAYEGGLVVRAGTHWLAVGDAAMSFDPLCSRGLLTALFSGLAAAEACDRRLSNKSEGFDDYRVVLDDVEKAYQRERAEVYLSAGSQWPGAAFWDRRADPPPACAKERVLTETE